MKRRFVYFTVFTIIMVTFFSAFSQPKPDPTARYSVEVAEVSASSYVTSEKNNLFRYHPVMAFDGISETSWNEGVAGFGKGEWLRIDLYDEILVDAITIMPGYYNKKWYRANNRISKIGVEILPSYDYMSFDFIDGMDVKKIEFTARKLKSVRFSIEDVYSGAEYDDSCISEVCFFYKNRQIQLKGITEFKKLLAQNNDLKTPAGFLIDEGFMSFWEVFCFLDGVFIGRVPGEDPLTKGIWFLDEKTGEINFTVTEKEVFEGLGKRVTIEGPFGNDFYYENYKYYITKGENNPEKRGIRTIDWLGFKKTMGFPSTSPYFKIITTRDYNLRILPRPDYKTIIEKYRMGYRQLLAEGNTPE
jgi:hypothetical protein